MAGISSKAAGKLGNKKSLYNGYELDVDFEINLYESFYRLHDPQLGRFWQVDPKPVMDNSEYEAMGNNPISNFDLLGDEFHIDNSDDSKKDILNLVKKKNREYVTFVNDGNVKIDFGNLTEKQKRKLLAQDEGLNLLNDLYIAKEKYLYEASEIFLGLDEDYYKKGETLYGAPIGIVNSSNGGKDALGHHTERPREGFDGQVTILPSAIYYEASSDFDNSEVIKSRSAVIFHELSENYERTTNRLDYKDAHQKAKDRELKYDGRSLFPGKQISYQAPTITPEHANKIHETIMNYLVN